MTKTKRSRRAPKTAIHTGEVMELVKIEIRASEIFNVRLMSKLEGNGWRAHAKKSLFLAHVGDELTGWLARELATHDDHVHRDEGCWSWDVTKPIAEQWPNVPGSPLRVWSGVTDDEAKAVSSTLGNAAFTSIGSHALSVDELEVPNRQIKDMIRGFVLGAEKPPCDPLDVEQRAAWDADLDAMERGQ